MHWEYGRWGKLRLLHFEWDMFRLWQMKRVENMANETCWEYEQWDTLSVIITTETCCKCHGKCDMLRLVNETLRMWQMRHVENINNEESWRIIMTNETCWDDDKNESRWEYSKWDMSRSHVETMANETCWGYGKWDMLRW